MTERPDHELLAFAQHGDQAAVQALYQRYATFVYHWVDRRVDRQADAEDLTSDIMIRMVESIPTTQFRTTFKAWLFGVARHVLADHWRRVYRLPEAALDPDLVRTDPEIEPDPMDDGRLRSQAEHVLSQLPDNYRQVIQHRFYDQRSLAETAQAMHTTVGNVKVLQYRALKQAAALASNL